MTKPELSILVVSYNTKEMTLECLRSIFRETTSTRFEVVVLDNSSKDDSANAITEEFGARIKLIASNENHGFAVGNNKAAFEANGEYLLLLNPDTVVLNHAIDQLMEFAKARPSSGIWGGRTVFANNSLNPASCWSRQTLWSLTCQAVGLNSLFRKSSIFNSEGIGGWNRDGIREVDIVSGCFLLIRHDLWRTLNGFNPEFFMYGEEADLCLRARQLGAKPTVTSDATIIHYGGASEKVRADKLIKLLKAKMLLIRNHFPASKKRLGRFLLAAWPIIRSLAHLALSQFRRSSHESHLVWREVCQRKSEWLVPFD